MPNITVRAAAERMPDVNRRTILTGIGAVALTGIGAVALVAVTCHQAESSGLGEAGSSDAIPATRTKTSLDAMLLELPPEEAHRLRIEILAILAAVKKMCARGDDFQTIRNFVRTQCEQNHMDWKRERGI